MYRKDDRDINGVPTKLRLKICCITYNSQRKEYKYRVKDEKGNDLGWYWEHELEMGNISGSAGLTGITLNLKLFSFNPPLISVVGHIRISLPHYPAASGPAVPDLHIGATWACCRGASRVGGGLPSTNQCSRGKLWLADTASRFSVTKFVSCILFWFRNFSSADP